LASLQGLPGVAESALLSTCNRTEIYAVAGDGAALEQWLDAHTPGLGGYLYRHSEADAVRHLFRVATGLDSMVLGEPQILGQVKEAWALARQHGALGTRLDRLFQQTFAVAKRARTDTRTGVNPISVAPTAVRLAQDSFAHLPGSTVLLVGAGETIELAARHLVKGGVGRLLVANRTLAHAQDLAGRHGGYALPLAELDRHLAEADVVFSATASREPVPRRGQGAAARSARRREPALLFDLAVPRDIEPDVAALADAYVYTVDGLERAVQDNRRGRHEAAEAAEAIVDLQVARYMEAARAVGRQETLKRLRSQGESTREEILARARQQLAGGRAPDEVLRFLAHTLTNRLLHPPTAALREAALSGDAELARAAERLFPALPGDVRSCLDTQSSDDPEPAPQ